MSPTKLPIVLIGLVIAGLFAVTVISSQVSHDWTEILNVQVMGQHINTGAIIGNDADFTVCKRLGISAPCPSFCYGVSYWGPTVTGGPNLDGRYNGDLGGYSGARLKCIIDYNTPRGPDTDYHICTAEEMLMAATCGVPVAEGWYATGISSRVDASGDSVRDCRGWSIAGTINQGNYWANDNPFEGSPERSDCNVLRPVLCCRGGQDNIV